MNMNRKNMRKLGSSREETREFSQLSVLSAMDRFVQAVDNMNETVMVPSRLMDMPVINDEGTTPGNNNASDLYGFYSMLNSVKTELIWGPGNLNNRTNNTSTTTTTTVGNSTPSSLSSSRRMSTVSSLSLSSDSEAETESSCSESDSGLPEFEDQSVKIAGNFRHHLVGLYQVLEQLTDTADGLTCRYQQEVESAS